MGNLWSDIKKKYLSSLQRPPATTYDVNEKCHPTGLEPETCKLVPLNTIKYPSYCQSCPDVDTFVAVYDFKSTAPKKGRLGISIYEKVDNNMLFWATAVVMLLASAISFKRYFVLNYFFQLGNGMFFRFLFGFFIAFIMMYFISEQFYVVPPFRTQGMLLPAGADEFPQNATVAATNTDINQEVIVALEAMTQDEKALLGDKDTSLWGFFGLPTTDSAWNMETWFPVTSSTFNVRILMFFSSFFAVLFSGASYGNAPIKPTSTTGRLLRFASVFVALLIAYYEAAELGHIWWSDVFKVFGMAATGSLAATIVYNVLYKVFDPVQAEPNPITPGTKIIKFHSIYRSWMLGGVLLGILVAAPYAVQAAISR